MIKVAEPIIGIEEIEAAIEVLKSGMYTSGKNVREFEKEFAKYVGTRYAVACNSGTAALHMSLLALFQNDELSLPREVIVPPMTFFATISSVIMSRMEPVFVDVKADCNINEDLIEKSITPFTKAIIPVHFYGKPCDMHKIMEIAKKYNLSVIEDCAQAHGGEWKGKKVGSFGDCGCFSFFATKNMTTIEGGMITTDRKDVYEKALLLRSHGMVDRDNHSLIGYNYRMNELSAAIGLIQLRKLDEMNKKRIENSKYLFENIKVYEDSSSGFGRNIDDEIVPGHVYFWYPVSVGSKTPSYQKKAKDYLKKNGIGFRHRYLKPLNTQPVFKGKYLKLQLRMANSMAGSVIGLPNHPNLTKRELDTIIEVINNYEPYSHDKRGSEDIFRAS